MQKPLQDQSFLYLTNICIPCHLCDNARESVHWLRLHKKITFRLLPLVSILVNSGVRFARIDTVYIILIYWINNKFIFVLNFYSPYRTWPHSTGGCLGLLLLHFHGFMTVAVYVSSPCGDYLGCGHSPPWMVFAISCCMIWPFKRSFIN